MRRLALAWSVGLALLVACGPDGEPEPDTVGGGEAEPTVGEAAAAEEPAATAARAVVRGTVRDAGTDRPLAGTLVSVGDLGTSTDAAGEFVLPRLPPGESVLRIRRRGFLADTVMVSLDPGSAVAVDVDLEPAPPACCTLGGTWRATFELDSAGLNSRPRSRRLEGRVSFTPVRPEGVERPVQVAETRGSTDLDFAPLLGAEAEAGVDDVEGAAFHGDSVSVTLLPRFGDWAIEMRGRLSADTIRGDWFQRASCCGAYGRFVLVREGDASVRGG